jgi:hypothetical protein
MRMDPNSNIMPSEDEDTQHVCLNLSRLAQVEETNLKQKQQLLP